MPAAPDDDRPHPSSGTATLVAGLADDVAFLDAPGVAVGDLIEAVDEALTARPALSVLTVYSDDPACGAAIDDLCGRHDVAVVATIPHEAGTTFTLRRGQPGADPPDDAGRSAPGSADRSGRPRCIHDDRDAEEADGGAEQVVAVGAEAVGDHPPQQ